MDPPDEAVSFDYDWDADVLYVSLGPPRPARGEQHDDIVLRYALDTDELVGITVLGYRAMGAADELLRRIAQMPDEGIIGLLEEQAEDLREAVPA